MRPPSKNSFGARGSLSLSSGTVAIYRFAELERQKVADVSRHPLAIKILLEAALRAENGREITRDDVLRLASYDPKTVGKVEIPFMPARILMQDFTGVPAVVDLAALRSAMARLGKDPRSVNPGLPVDLVIDHSVQVDAFGSHAALHENARLELSRNRERYQLLKWAKQAFRDFRVVPPATGICHQINLEYFAKVVVRRAVDGIDTAFPDTVLGTDSHTTMVNGLGVLGWGVGGIEAEAALLGQPSYLLLPPVVGVRLNGALRPGVSATDLVLTVTKTLRAKGVVDKLVEFFGDGLAEIAVADRATIANMCPEYGATAAFFPVDDQTLAYLRQTGRTADEIDLVERYSKEQGLFCGQTTPTFADVVEVDLAQIETCIAGPKRPQDRIALAGVKREWRRLLSAPVEENGYGLEDAAKARTARVTYPDGSVASLAHGDVTIAAITSCTNTSNPRLMLAAGLLAKKAVAAGLRVKPHVKTSLAPGSRVVSRYLDEAGLTPALEALGFHTVGYGCTTCIGNSGPLAPHVAAAVTEGKLVVASVLSGNRNFEGRVHPLTRANFLASPPLVVAYALAGTVDIEFEAEPVGRSAAGKDVFLRDLWPSAAEIAEHLAKAQDPQKYLAEYQQVENGNEGWNAIQISDAPVFAWDPQSTYVREPPFFTAGAPTWRAIGAIHGARVLLDLGDNVTTDHISPAGDIPADSPAGRYLTLHGVAVADFNSYGSRRGNDEVMTRGTFANIRLRNRLVPGREGGYTVNHLTGEIASVFEVAAAYRDKQIASLVLAGAEYGMGSSRDWAAKGTRLLGIEAVIAKSFERIHRSNLIGMGVLPLMFLPGQDALSLGLSGAEVFDIALPEQPKPQAEVQVTATRADGGKRGFAVRCRLDSAIEVDYYRHGGILQAVLQTLASAAPR
ncbi:MAG: aconitate hydratase AcnA [Deltaproteobacteria bacterium]|nr:aconitate hydratase AcnA [Deltaproteobacteria bacterium]